MKETVLEHRAKFWLKERKCDVISCLQNWSFLNWLSPEMRDGAPLKAASNHFNGNIESAYIRKLFEKVEHAIIIRVWDSLRYPFFRRPPFFFGLQTWRRRRDCGWTKCHGSFLRCGWSIWGVMGVPQQLHGSCWTLLSVGSPNNLGLRWSRSQFCGDQVWGTQDDQL
jgi:hypothetical protein